MKKQQLNPQDDWFGSEVDDTPSVTNLIIDLKESKSKTTDEV